MHIEVLLHSNKTEESRAAKIRGLIKRFDHNDNTGLIRVTGAPPPMGSAGLTGSAGGGLPMGSLPSEPLCKGPS